MREYLLIPHSAVEEFSGNENQRVPFSHHITIERYSIDRSDTVGSVHLAFSRLVSVYLLFISASCCVCLVVHGHDVDELVELALAPGVVTEGPLPGFAGNVERY